MWLWNVSFKANQSQWSTAHIWKVRHLFKGQVSLKMGNGLANIQQFSWISSSCHSALPECIAPIFVELWRVPAPFFAKKKSEAQRLIIRLITQLSWVELGLEHSDLGNQKKWSSQQNGQVTPERTRQRQDVLNTWLSPWKYTSIAPNLVQGPLHVGNEQEQGWELGSS